MEKLTQELINIGLSEKEAQIYLSSLSLGASSVQNIAKKANVNRVTTYVMIEQLTQKGLMSTFMQGKKKMFVAEKPIRLLSLIHEREQELSDQEVRFRQTLGPLTALMAQSEHKTQLRFYEGIEGIKACHEVLLTAMKQEQISSYWEIIVPSMSGEIFNDGSSPAREEARKEIVKRKMSVKKIFVVDGPKYADDIFSIASRAEIRYIPEKKYPFNGEIGVYGNYTVFWIFRDDYSAVLIEDSYLATNMNVMFDLIWSIGSTEPIGGASSVPE